MVCAFEQQLLQSDNNTAQKIYHIIDALKAQSDFKWDDQHGADIDENSEVMWKAYILV